MQTVKNRIFKQKIDVFGCQKNAIFLRVLQSASKHTTTEY